MIHVHLFGDVVNFDHKEVEVKSLHQHPTERSHQEILHEGCCCNTRSLAERKKLSTFHASFQRDLVYFFVLVISLSSKYSSMDEEVAYFVFCGVYPDEKNKLSSSEGNRKTQSYL